MAGLNAAPSSLSRHMALIRTESRAVARIVRDALLRDRAYLVAAGGVLFFPLVVWLFVQLEKRKPVPQRDSAFVYTVR